MKVAAVIDQHTVAVTREGTSHPVGGILSIRRDIMSNGKVLGHHEKIRVRITEVQDQIYLAETYRILTGPPPGLESMAPVSPVTVNIGDTVVAL